MPRRARDQDYIVTNLSSPNDINTPDEFSAGLAQSIELVDAESVQSSATRRRLNGSSPRRDPTGQDSSGSQSDTIDLTQDDTVKTLFPSSSQTPILHRNEPTLKELIDFAIRCLEVHEHHDIPFVTTEDNRVVILAARHGYAGLVLQVLVRVHDFACKVVEHRIFACCMLHGMNIMLQASGSASSLNDDKFLDACSNNNYRIFRVDSIELIDDIVHKYLWHEGSNLQQIIDEGEERRTYLHQARLNSRIGAGGTRYYYCIADDPFFDAALETDNPDFAEQYMFWYLDQLHKDATEAPSEFVYKPRYVDYPSDDEDQDQI